MEKSLQEQLHGKSPRIRNQPLYDEIDEYTKEIRADARRRNSKLVGKILIIGFAAIVFLLTICSFVNPSPAVFSMDELTAHPATILNDASIKVAEKTTPGRMYVVKVSVEPL